MGTFWEEAVASDDQAYPDTFSEEEFFSVPTVKDIVDLIHIGKIEETFNLFTHSFTMRSLNTGDEFKVASLIKDLQDSPIARNRALATATVAASLERVDGKPLAIAIKENEEVLYRKFSVVLELTWTVIEELYKKYLEIEDRVTEAFRDLEKKAQGPTSYSFLESQSDKDSLEETSTESSS